jgi:hypothetical protein
MMAATATAVVVVVTRLVGEVGGKVGGVASGKVSGMVGGCVLCLMPTTIGIVQTCIGINLFWSKLELILFGMAGHAQ